MSTCELLATPLTRQRPRYAVGFVEQMLPIAKEDTNMIVVMRASATEHDIEAVLSVCEVDRLGVNAAHLAIPRQRATAHGAHAPWPRPDR